MLDEAVSAQIGLARAHSLDLSPQAPRRLGERWHSSKTKAGIHAHQHITGQAAQPIEHTSA